MASTSIELSLKGERPTWGGLVDLTDVSPASGLFTTMLGCVVGKDGTEIVRYPGTVQAAQPKYYDRMTVHGGDPGSGSKKPQIAIDTTTTPDTVTAYFRKDEYTGHGLKKDQTYTCKLDFAFTSTTYVATDTVTVTVQSQEVLTFTVDTTSWGSATELTTTSGMFVPRVGTYLNSASQPKNTSYHGLKWVNGYPAVVTDTVHHDPRNEAKLSLATFVSLGSLNYLLAGIATERPWEYWPNPVNSLYNNYYNFQPQGASNPPTPPTIFSHQARRKANLHVTNDDLIIAVPGFGCPLTATLRAAFEGTGNTVRWTRKLGVPKGSIFAARTGTVVQNWKNFPTTHKINFRVGYRDRYTGEVGLPSELWQVSLAGVAANKAYVELFASDPRLMESECSGLSIVVYTSGASESPADTGYYPIYEVQVDANRHGDAWSEKFTDKFKTTTSQAWLFDFASVNTTQTLYSWDQYPQFPTLEHAPMGASWSVTVRGVTFYGGPISHSGDLGSQRMKGEVSKRSVVRGSVANELRFNHFPQSRAKIADAGTLSASHRLPSAYQGSVARMPLHPGDSKTPKNWEHGRIRLKEQKDDVESTTTYGASLKRSTIKFNGLGIRQFPWSFEDGHYYYQKHAIDPFDISVAMSRGQIWFSEQEHPGITPAINRIIFDRLQGVDIRAAGRLRDALIVMTDEETYRISWGRSPLGSSPTLISDVYGCIAPNSIVEFPGGLGWLSKDGPVLCDGSTVRWIGVSIKKTWDTFKTDSYGLMWQSIGAYDEENYRIMWGVRADLHQSSSPGGGLFDNDPINPVNTDWDDGFSKLPNDTILTYNTASDAFSIHQVKAGQEIVDLERMPDSSGVWRMFALEEDGNIYQFDDRMQDHLQNTTQEICTTANTTGEAIFKATGIAVDDITIDTKLMVRDVTTGDVLWFGTALAASTSGQVTLTPTPTGVTWSINDILEVGITQITLESTYKMISGSAFNQDTFSGVALVHTVENNHPSPPETLFEYGRITVTDSEGNFYYVGKQWGQRLAEADRRTLFETGFGSGFELSKIKIEIFGNAHVRLKDVLFQVARTG
jgi:hypothetical protein